MRNEISDKVERKDGLRTIVKVEREMATLFSRRNRNSGYGVIVTQGDSSKRVYCNTYEKVTAYEDVGETIELREEFSDSPSQNRFFLISPHSGSVTEMHYRKADRLLRRRANKVAKAIAKKLQPKVSYCLPWDSPYF
jgi:hypothetical protein